MYMPYLRGKQFELLALKEHALLLGRSKKIIPIIEPVVDSSTSRKRKSDLANAIDLLNKTDAPYAVITNPQVGDLKGKELDLTSYREFRLGRNALVGILINNQITLRSIQRLLNKYEKYPVCLIYFTDKFSAITLNGLLAGKDTRVIHAFIDGHVNSGYHKQLVDGDKVLIKDGFHKAKRNADYDNNVDEFFSDIFKDYEKLGYSGFGDFTTIGMAYDFGGRAHAVAIHLTYFPEQAESKHIRVRHFVSDEKETHINTSGKFIQALNKLVEFLKRNPHLSSESCREFLRLHQRKHFPQLGPIKKLSIKHHISLINDLLRLGR